MTKQETIESLIEHLKNDNTLHDTNARLHFAIGYMLHYKDIQELLEVIAYGNEGGVNDVDFRN